MNFLLDAGVPISVGRTLQEHNHSVIFYPEVLPEKATDLHVCETALRNDAILVAIDGDMRRIANRFGNNPRFDKLSLLHFGCNEALAAKRLTQAMALIEAEWAFKLEKASRRLWFEVTGQYFKTVR
ncbi:DUF5615 family PIN-like protein [Rhizobium sophoriradicis]|uniref:DUF5615 domain-containing protein n=1 Tax=Rhizobium sophoriradicis TaxID=1535245 RepID=A0A2A5KWP5_9HYPH|nr:DUF5615 family PIN-like protein [Rhizobium sophoriradicis]PCK81482.1 hypothetical protein CPT34_09775 [Rhizobium sophoriradicis]